MAEAYLRHLDNDRFEAWSAGISPAGIHPMTRRVLDEARIDISSQTSKSVNEIPISTIDYLVTVCDYAQGICPPFPKKVRSEHWPIEDPIGFVGTEEERFGRFCETRDEIRDRVSRLIEKLRSLEFPD